MKLFQHLSRLFGDPIEVICEVETPEEKLERMVRERRESFEVKLYRKNREAQIRNRPARCRRPYAWREIA